MTESSITRDGSFGEMVSSALFPGDGSAIPWNALRATFNSASACIPLWHMRFEKRKFHGFDFSCASIEHCAFLECEFHWCRFNSAQVRFSQFRGNGFYNCTFNGAHFVLSHMGDGFEDCDLRLSSEKSSFTILAERCVFNFACGELMGNIVFRDESVGPWWKRDLLSTLISAPAPTWGNYLLLHRNSSQTEEYIRQVLRRFHKLSNGVDDFDKFREYTYRMYGKAVPYREEDLVVENRG